MRPVLVILSFGVFVINCQKDMLHILNSCYTTLNLSEQGFNSSLSLNLSTTLVSHKSPCKIKIIAPNTHLLYIRVVDNYTELTTLQNTDQKNIETNDELFQKQLDHLVNGKSIDNAMKTAEDVQHCPINIYQPDNSQSPIYTTDPCSTNLNADGGLLSPQVDLTYTSGSGVKDRWLLITAVGTGEVCLNSRYHTCLKVGWTPLLCISKDLLCDGVVNCPTGQVLGDEDPQFCKDRKSDTNTNWEKLANDFLKKFTGKSKGVGTLLPAIRKGDNKWLEQFQSTIPPNFRETDYATPSPNVTNSNIKSTLTQYGPWGYLMLGMLICGTVLTFCGLWECCCRRNKTPQPPVGSGTPSGVSVTSGGVASTAVLVVTQGPPKYEELDQPPSYSVLFPKKDEV